jgi:hypothetical protein
MQIKVATPIYLGKYDFIFNYYVITIVFLFKNMLEFITYLFIRADILGAPKFAEHLSSTLLSSH